MKFIFNNYLFMKKAKCVYLTREKYRPMCTERSPYRYNHAIAFANGSATSEEGDDKNYGAHGYEKRRHGKEAVVKEMLILMVHSMDDHADR